jgi:hypothetical protein
MTAANTMLTLDNIKFLHKSGIALRAGGTLDNSRWLGCAPPPAIIRCASDAEDMWLNAANDVDFSRIDCGAFKCASEET